MRTFCLQVLPAVALAFGFASLLEAAGPFGALVQKLPDGANVLVVINVEQILQSDYARSRGSQKKLAEAFEERSILIPPDATQFVMAAQYDVEHFTRNWEAAAMGLKTPINFSRMASATRRSVETLGGIEAIGCAKVFALKLSDQELGLLAPSNRQHAARWAQQLKRSDQGVSDYLAQMGNYGDTAGTDIIVAIDLADAFPQKFLAERLRKNEVLKDRNVDIEKLASIFAGVRGIRLGIKINTKCSAMLVVDLQDDPAPAGNFAKPLLLSALGKAGILLEEMADWKPAITRNTISLQGELSDDGLRRLMGLVELPTDSIALIDANSAASAKSGSQSAESVTREASQKYFRSIEQQLDSLRLQKKDAKSMGQIALWIDNIARRIDRMSTLNVDPDLAEYGATIASELRDVVASLQGIGIQSGARQAQIYGGDSSYYGDYDVDGARRAVRAEEKAAGATTSLDLSRVIASQRAAMRRKMTDRYKVDF